MNSKYYSPTMNHFEHFGLFTQPVSLSDNDIYCYNLPLWATMYETIKQITISIEQDWKDFSVLNCWTTLSFNGIWHDLTRFESIWQDLTGFNRIWQDSTRFNMIWQDLTRFNRIWEDFTVFKSICHDLTWLDRNW